MQSMLAPTITAALSSALTPTDSWKMLYAYPKHYISSKLSAGEVIRIDG
jgi:hypothetical protein